MQYGLNNPINYSYLRTILIKYNPKRIGHGHSKNTTIQKRL